MKEPNELNEVLAKAVEKGIEVAERTGKFVIDQAPDLLQEFYRWNISKNAMGVAFAILLFLIGRYLPYMWLEKTDSNSNDGYRYDLRFFSRWGDEVAIGAYVLFILMTIISSIWFINDLYNLVFILSAPKLYLIEYFLNK